MTSRSIVKIVVVLTATLVGLVALAVIGVVGYFLLGLAFPERMDITGRVTNSSGEPVKGIEIRAVPLPLHDPYSDSAMEPQDTEHTVISDENGRYRFKGLVAAVGAKEGRCMQGYDVVARAEGCSSPVVRVCKHPDDRRDVITLADLVLEEEPAIRASGPGL